MKPLKIVLPLLLLSLSPLQQANAIVTSQSCYDTYSSDYYNPELLSTTCTTSTAYTLEGTADVKYTNGSPFSMFSVTGTMTQNETLTTEISGYSYGQLYTVMTLEVVGLGSYSMTRLDDMGWGITYVGPVTNSLTGGFTTDSTTQWDIWSDGINAVAQTLDGDSNGKSGFNIYVGGVKSFVADVHVETLATVPVPAAFWLFGSGFMGLFTLTQRRK